MLGVGCWDLLGLRLALGGCPLDRRTALRSGNRSKDSHATRTCVSTWTVLIRPATKGEQGGQSHWGSEFPRIAHCAEVCLRLTTHLQQPHRPKSTSAFQESGMRNQESPSEADGASGLTSVHSSLLRQRRKRRPGRHHPCNALPGWWPGVPRGAPGKRSGAWGFGLGQAGRICLKCDNPTSP